MYGEEDDRHWLAGTIYFNRDDPRLLVTKRLGLGFGRTLNLARPISWVIVAVPLVIVVLTAIAKSR